MGMCKGCGEVFSTNLMINGYCQYCLNPEVQEEKEKNLKRRSLIIITTETHIDLAIENRIGIISSQCIYGINIIKDLFSFVRDIVGGRIKSIETGLDEANANIIEELKQKAYLLGGDAVIGVKIEHTYNNANNGSILSVFATGTVVKLAKES